MPTTGTNEFLPFAIDPEASIISQALWAGDTLRPKGHIPGTIANSALENKALRQATTMAAALGLLISEQGENALDNGDIESLKIALADAIIAVGGGEIQQATETIVGITRYATTVEAEAGTMDTVALTPLKFAQALAKLASSTIANATEEVAGIAKIAKAADVTAKTDDSKIMTPKKTDTMITAALTKAIVDATEAIKGIAMLATLAEAEEGTNDNKIMTPKKTKVAVKLNAPFNKTKLFDVPGSYSWTVPENVKRIVATVQGAGGGGKSVISLSTPSGSADSSGAGGGCAENLIIDVKPGTTISIVVGAGGLPGTYADDDNIYTDPKTFGKPGGLSSIFSSDTNSGVIARGGEGGGWINGYGVAALGGIVEALGTTVLTAQCNFKGGNASMFRVVTDTLDGYTPGGGARLGITSGRFLSEPRNYGENNVTALPVGYGNGGFAGSSYGSVPYVTVIVPSRGGHGAVLISWFE